MSEPGEAIPLQEYIERIVAEYSKRLDGIDGRFDKLDARISSHAEFDINTSMRVASLDEALRSFREQSTNEFKSQKEAVSMALQSAKEAVTKAENANEKRFESVNEFRSTLADQQRNLMPRSEVDVLIRAQNEKIAAIQSEQVELRGSKSGHKEGFSWAVGVVGFIVTVLLLINIIVSFRNTP